MPQKTHDTLVVQIEGLDYLDIRKAFGAPAISERLVASQLNGYLGLLAPGETIHTMPGIADHWEVNTNKTEWTFTLREDAKFHDGTVIDAKAVKYSIEANVLAFYSLYEISVNMSDAADLLISQFGLNITFPTSDPNGNGNTVIFSGDWFPDPFFEWDMAGAYHEFFPLLPYGSHGHYSDSTEICQEKYGTYCKHPMSAGPYMLASENDSIPGTSVTLTRFNDWFGWEQTFTASNNQEYTFPSVKKAFKHIKFQIIETGETARMYLLNNEVDITTSRFHEIEVLHEINKSNYFSTCTRRANGFSAIGFNIQGDWPSFYGGPGNFPLSEPWFRQAVSHALNRTKFVENVFNGLAYEMNAFIPSGILDTFPNMKSLEYYDYNYDLDKANQLLDEAGYFPLGFAEESMNRFGYGLYANETTINGVNQINGRHFNITTMFTGGEWTITRALEIKDQLREVGIYVDVIAYYDWEDYRETMLSGDWGYTYNTTGPQPDPNFNGQSWDFDVAGWFYNFYDVPFAWPYSFSHWLYPLSMLGQAQWYNEDNEIAIAKIFGGIPGECRYGDFISAGIIETPSDMPKGGYPVPEWSNENPQFMEGCRILNAAYHNELPWVPLARYMNAYAFTINLKNFLPPHGRYGGFHFAYSYWE
jgi:ABC-type transport system substrate-binding protein